MKKHNTIKTLCLSALLLLSGLRASAQLEQSIFLNGTLPLGTMHKVYTPNSFLEGLSGGAQLLTMDQIGTNATLGFGGGYRVAYRFDVGFGQVAPFANVDFIWNQVRPEMREANTMNDYKSVQYFNLPAFLGVAYYYDGLDMLTPFAEFGLGYDFLFITAEGNKDAIYLKYNVQDALAWQVGAGCYFGSHVSLSVHYYALGKHYVKYSDKSLLPPGFPVDDKFKPLGINQLLLRLGFHF